MAISRASRHRDVAVFRFAALSRRLLTVTVRGLTRTAGRRRRRDTRVQMHAWVSLVVVVVLTGVIAPAAHAGPWSRLPDAVARLQVDPGYPEAEAVLAQAEASIAAEAAAGRLAVVKTLVDAYASLVLALPDGEERLGSLERRMARVLVAWGDANRDRGIDLSGAAWALAGTLDRNSIAVERLRLLLLPPVDREAGTSWVSPVDDAVLVFHPSMLIRMGCTDGDRRCRDDEVYFRYVNVPDLWIERDEVTNRRYQRCVKAGGCTPPTDPVRFLDPDRADHPVVGVTWNQARAYAAWVSRQLPSEAAWERAARGSETGWRYPWGNARAEDRANVWVETDRKGNGTMPVGSFEATGFGINDIAGNVWEWCEDQYQPGLKQVPHDGSPVRTGWGRVVRGGSWRRSIDLARVSARSSFDEGSLADDLGFRCMVKPAGEQPPAPILAAAIRAFPIQSDPGHDLESSGLAAEDRRYLERRSITWLLLEGRPSEAVSLAVGLMRREPRDQAARALLEQAENEVAQELRSGNSALAKSVVPIAARVAQEDRRVTRRMEAMTTIFVGAMVDAASAIARSGDRRGAVATLRIAQELAPNDQRIAERLNEFAPRPGDVLRWAGDGKVMTWIPGGSFRFGASLNDHNAMLDELPAIQVRVSGFWIDQSEVTNNEYRQCVESGSCTPPLRTDAFDDPNRGRYPVLGVSWYQAKSYARWAGKRLPTESEWERAARAGSATRFPWGNRWDPSHANGLGLDDDGWGGPAPVMSYSANAWGTFDMLGNAAEWVEDVYHGNLVGAPRNGSAWEQITGPIAERQRVIRGGSYVSTPSRSRVSFRTARRPDDTHRTLGFRCAADE